MNWLTEGLRKEFALLYFMLLLAQGLLVRLANRGCLVVHVWSKYL